MVIELPKVVQDFFSYHQKGSWCLSIPMEILLDSENGLAPDTNL